MAFVKTEAEVASDCTPRLSYFTLISPNSEFTPVQKNVIALIHQGKIQSANSPIRIQAQEYTRENIFDLIHKRAQDIDTDNIDTQKVLSQVGTYRKGEANYIQQVIEQRVERRNFYR